jgi:hypothetical protein
MLSSLCLLNSLLLHSLHLGLLHLMQLRNQARKECADHAVAPLLKSTPHALLAQSLWKGALPLPHTGQAQPPGP